MPRPPAVHSDACVDADVCARAGSVIDRHFSGADLPRLSEAGGRDASELDARFSFSLFDGHPAVDGTLHGKVVLKCQRCMKPVSVALEERFQVIVVREERSDEPGGYEPVIADPSRLDLRWLAEDQVLLALPLVPMHEGDECNDVPAQSAEDEVRQRPFQNLRALLRERRD
jgi:DUF177 domain-containing protein